MPAPHLQRVEETFPEAANECGNVRLTIVNITVKQWAWLEPILRLLLDNVPPGTGSARE